MNPIALVLSCIALFFGQSTARISSTRGLVDGNAGRPLIEMDKVRTGADSMAVLALGPDITVALGEKTEIEIRKLGISTVLWLEHGDIHVTSRGGEIQIQSKSGWFSAAEWPFEMQLGNATGMTNVILTVGSLRTQNLDTAAVTFRATDSGAFRTYGAKTTVRSSPQTNDNPPIYLQPVITIGAPTTARLPIPKIPKN